MKTHALGYIRQLCCLGLGGEAIMPEVLNALHAFIPSYFNFFFWGDENHQLGNAYVENDDMYSVRALYVEQFYNSGERDAYRTTFSEAMRTGRGWGNSERHGRDYLNSDLYNTMLKPVGARYALEATICEGGRGLGSLVLERTSSDGPFTDADETRLRSLIPYIAHGLRSDRDVKGEMSASGESGTLIFNSEDKLVQFCPEGKRLLLLATEAKIFKRRGSEFFDPSALKRLCANLRGILKGEAHPIPVLRQQNVWGEFVFRAYPLSTDREPNGSIAVLIERHEPLPITLMRNMHTFSMTARQREACLFLSLGHSHSEIAQRMHVSKHTATDYVGKIYDKLDVRSREELVKKLQRKLTNETNDLRSSQAN